PSGSRTSRSSSRERPIPGRDGVELDEQRVEQGLVAAEHGRVEQPSPRVALGQAREQALGQNELLLDARLARKRQKVRIRGHLPSGARWSFTGRGGGVLGR